MQYLLQKNRFGTYSFATKGAQAEAYSPFAHSIEDIQNKRSKLFPDRMRVPGRKTKYILAIAYLIHFRCLVQLLHKKKTIGLRREEQSQYQRKASPFFQSLEAVQYTILKHRYDLLAKEVMGEEFLKKSHFHNPNIGWQDQLKNVYPWVRHGRQRYVGGLFEKIGKNYWHGFEIHSI